MYALDTCCVSQEEIKKKINLSSLYSICLVKPMASSFTLHITDFQWMVSWWPVSEFHNDQTIVGQGENLTGQIHVPLPLEVSKHLQQHPCSI
jgi:hypothetical protein